MKLKEKANKENTEVVDFVVGIVVLDFGFDFEPLLIALEYADYLDQVQQLYDKHQVNHPIDYNFHIMFPNHTFLFNSKFQSIKFQNQFQFQLLF